MPDQHNAAPAGTGSGAEEDRRLGSLDSSSATTSSTPEAIPNLPAFLDRREKHDVTKDASSFEYDRLDPEVADLLKERTAAIRTLVGRTTSIIIETGTGLATAKKKLEHGQFTEWCELEIGISIRTAQNYMKVATWAEGKSEIVSCLPPSALYRISAKSVPEDVTAAVLDLVRSGKPVTDGTVIFLINEARFNQREAQQKARANYNRSKKARDRREAERLRKEERRKLEEEKSRTKARDIVEKFGADDARFILETFRANPFLSQFLAEDLEAPS